VTLPPGRQGFQLDLPRQDRPQARHNDGNRLGRILGRPDAWVPCRYHDDINLETHQLGRKLRARSRSLRISVLNGDVLSFYVAKLAQSCRIPSARAESVAASVFDRYPIRGTFFGCCASAVTQASNTTATRIDGTAAFFIAHLVSSVIYHADRDKESAIYTVEGDGDSSSRKSGFS
jgi:hypothetical protein